MVIKTEVCAFSDTRIYPGHGIRFIRRDGQVIRSTGRIKDVVTRGDSNHRFDGTDSPLEPS